MQNTKLEKPEMSIFSIFSIFSTDVRVKNKFACNEGDYLY